MSEVPSAAVPADVANLRLTPEGERRIVWAGLHMPVLRDLRRRFGGEKPLKGLRVAACLQVTSETANLMCTSFRASSTMPWPS